MTAPTDSQPTDTGRGRDREMTLLDQAGADLRSAEQKLTRACTAAQEALDAAWDAADAYDATRRRHVAALGTAGVTIPPGTGGDGTDGVAVRARGRLYLPAAAVDVLDWLAWRTRPAGAVRSPLGRVSTLMRAPWTAEVPPTARSGAPQP